MTLRAWTRWALSRLSHRAPLDDTREGSVSEDTPAPPASVDVIVPIFGAAPELLRCLDSLARHPDPASHTFVLVVDGPQPPDVEEALASGLGALPSGRTRLLRNPERRGFVASVNRGMADLEADVVLLNSDTEVTAGWLEKLQAAAYSSGGGHGDALLQQCDSGIVAASVRGQRHSRGAHRRLVRRAGRARFAPRVSPDPHGRRPVPLRQEEGLDALGLFDEERFGLGYGEENDFCFRALKAGYLNVLDDATFIFHAGHRSFGASRSARVKAAERRLTRIHPEYLPTIARFMREDPLGPARERVLAALMPPRISRSGGGPARVAHLLQGWPPFNHAGTEAYARSLAVRQAGWRDVSVHARLEDAGRELGEATELQDGGIRVRLVVNNFTQRDPRSRRNALHNPTLERDFARFLDEQRPELVHVHHLAGHSLGLLRVIAARRLPLVLQVQDWWLVCARANLSMADRSLCPGPSTSRCARCMPLTGVPPGGAPDPPSLRPSPVPGQPLGPPGRRPGDGLGVRRGKPAAHRPPGPGRARSRDPVRRRKAPAARAGPGQGRPLRFGFLGAIMPHKGVHVAVEAFRGVDAARATLDVVGDLNALPAYTRELQARATPAVRFAGRVPEAEKARLLSDLDILVVPSLGLESFGLAAREAMAGGVPVLASRRGALTEAFEDGVCGAYFEPGDAAGLRAWVDRLDERPQIVAEWARRLPAVKTMDAHAEEIEAVYAQVMAARRIR